ncbi:TMEM175 family protein [Streptomyces sp. cf386]|uniref:TMEM175 family protein n=1 Tax=Streptomyces sp. cf386 TaxID=1761904 RepID=UPI0015A43E68|nr:TMEM175 family protein [Streptomyces sp. cf386]
MWKSKPDGGPERLVALADGVFAIALTLLVLDFYVPRGLGSDRYDDALHELIPNLGGYALSVLVLGAFWREHRRIFGFVREIDGQVITLSLMGLSIAALVPFPTKLLSEYGGEPESVAIYAAAVAALGAAHLALLLVLMRRPWLRSEAKPAEGFRFFALDLAVTVVVFLASIPLALGVGATAAMWLWLAMAPIKVALGLRAGRAR